MFVEMNSCKRKKENVTNAKKEGTRCKRLPVVGFNYLILVLSLLFLSNISNAQNKQITGIDTVFVKNKLQVMLGSTDFVRRELSTAFLNKTYTMFNFYVQEKFKDVSTDYLLFYCSANYKFEGEIDALIMLGAYYVWDSKSAKFIDSLDFNLFNRLIATIKVPLNCHDKAILYNLLINQKEPEVYLIKAWRGRKVVRFKELYSNTFPTSYIFAELLMGSSFYKPELRCNKEVYCLLKSSSEEVFYLPVFVTDEFRKPIGLNIQVFTFNEKGELLKLDIIKNVSINPCKVNKRRTKGR